MPRAKAVTATVPPTTTEIGPRIFETGNESLAGAMLVVGFPTHGLVGSVAVSYLVHSMDMTPIGYMVSEGFPPTVVMEDGIVSAPVRFYASRLVCGLNKECDQLVVVLSDIQPAPETLNGIGKAILDWAEEKKIKLVVAVEGQPVSDQAEEVRVVAMANRAASKILERHHFDRANGVVTGFAGAVLLASVGRQLPVFCLVAQAHKEYPDARAAAKVIETINPLVPMMVIDTKPLRAKAAEIETEMRKSMTTQRESLDQMSQVGVGGMYR